ncbi:hypothetical protein H2200_010598 [Cladophialophora chaetospira]|uniref:NACHT domain-containing protein n=1 Tax=Cladophialophora chaetospira TaxID=386627 RepID=A0AA38X1R2_9EURO|nr:hypothetical protein H2200_010598 [Cladophialophora chaetospira]
MDPITALALACNVTQLVEQAIEAAVACKEIYERGSLDENNQIDKYAESVTVANKELEASLKNAATRDTRLQKLAQDVFDTATELRKVLSLLRLAKSQGARHIGRAFKTALRSKIQNGTVEKLRERLERQDTALRSSILKDLYVRGGKAELTRRYEFQKLSQGQQDIMAEVLQGQKLLLTDIRMSVKTAETNLLARLDIQDNQLRQTTQVVVNEIHTTLKKSGDQVIDRFDAQDVLLKEHFQKQDAQIRRTDEEVHDALKVRLLDALAFPEMNERRNMIEGHVNDFGASYHWLFHRQEELAEHDFVEWLQNGEEIYWVNGKPGSGKSTLMDYIYQSLQPKGVGHHHIKEWAEPYHVQLLSFWFFRPASSVLLKSLQGFWRSLCFQILDTDENVVKKIQGDEAAPQSLRWCLVQPGSRIRTWTDIELKSWFTYLVTNSASNFFLLVDGLDEVAHNRDILLSTIQFIAQSTDKVKLCCSSRPETPFLQALQHYPSLRLQDFNYSDIEEYCLRRLATTRAMQYANTISWRAQGVFLWAYLVTEDLKGAASQGDEEEDLKQRLEECPGEMYELFRFLLERQDKFYAKHPKPYLRLIEVATTERRSRSPYSENFLTLLELLVALSAQEDIISPFPESHDVSLLAALESKAAALKANLVARCANMIELLPRWHKADIYSDAFPYRELADAHNVEIRFIHRSAADFLVENDTAVTLFHSCNLTERDATIRLMIASIFSFLVDEQTDVKKSLQFGRLIDARLWTEAGTKTLDTIFPTLHARKPLLEPPMTMTKGQDAPNTGPFAVMCPQLSALENAVFGLAAEFNMVAYAEAKLRALDPEHLPFALGFAFCANLREDSFFESTELRGMPMPEPDLSSQSLTQKLSLWYYLNPNMNNEPRFYATCPVWQHIHLSLVDQYYKKRTGDAQAT